jgi:succinate-semialdehyde dehydrogenase/glutarate-semialdehyde dehydrogenase
MGSSAIDATVPHPAVPALRSYAPASGDLLAEVPVTRDDDVRRACARARKAQQAWAVLPVTERAERLLRLRDALAEQAEDLVEVVSRETGKPRHEALLHEVAALLDTTAWTCKHAPEVLAPERLAFHLLKHRAGEVRYVPRGVVGVISPWNYPLLIPMAGVVAALAAGNACVVKPSDATPLVMVTAKRIYDSTGLPEDLFSLVIGDGSTGRALIEGGIDHCLFTGGGEAGRKVAAACGARLVSCTLELGGKAPLLACEDCDLERTAQAIVFGAFANSGQACISVERVYAHSSIYDALVERVRALTAGLRQGDPSRDYVDVGAMVLPDQVDVVRRQIDDALRKGARLVSGGQERPGPGRFFEPTVLADCDHSMLVMKEETFGPVVPLMRVRDDDEAVALANDSHLGLNAYVFTRSRPRAERLAERIEAGSVVVNDVFSNYAASEAPFGGVKESGFGRVHGADGLRDMCHRKHVSFDRLSPPARDPYWFPYTAKSFHWLQRATSVLFGGGSLARRIGSLF